MLFIEMGGLNFGLATVASMSSNVCPEKLSLAEQSQRKVLCRQQAKLNLICAPCSQSGNDMLLRYTSSPRNNRHSVLLKFAGHERQIMRHMFRQANLARLENVQVAHMSQYIHLQSRSS